MRVVALTLFVAGLMLMASPALAYHGDGDDLCHDTSTADGGEMVTDTGYPPVCSAGGGLPGGGEVSDVGGEAGAGAVPTRIDAGGGGSAQAGNLVGIGGVLTGATTAAATLAVRRRRRS